MALNLGNQTNSNQNPGGSTQTRAHNHNAGIDSMLLVTIAMSNTVSVNSMTYNGVAMTQVRQNISSNFSSRYATFRLMNPSNGNNNIVITFSGAQWNSTAIFARSFSGASGTGNTGFADASNTPHSRSLNVSAGSRIFAMGNSNSAQNSGYVIDGVTQTNVGNGFNINSQVRAAYSQILTAGSKTVNTVTDFGTITNWRIEIQEAVAPAPTTRRRIIIT